MASFDIQDQFVMQKGPLSDQELVLKELMLRDTFFGHPTVSLGNAGVGATTGGAANPTTPPVVGQPSGGDVIVTQLGLVEPGDLITADFMNGVVRTLNQVIAYLRNQSRISPAAPQPGTTTPVPSAGAGIAGQLKDVVITPADAGDKVTVTFPAGTADHADFSDILIGSTRVDPGDMVKTEDGRFSFQVDKNVFTSGTDVRAVSKAGSSAQQVLRLFK